MYYHNSGGVCRSSLALCLTTLRAPPPMLRVIYAVLPVPNVYPWRDMHRPSPASVGYRRGGCLVTLVRHDVAFVTLQDAGGNTNWAVTRHQLPPLWVDKVDAVEEDVRLIQLKSKHENTIWFGLYCSGGWRLQCLCCRRTFILHSQSSNNNSRVAFKLPGTGSRGGRFTAE